MQAADNVSVSAYEFVFFLFQSQTMRYAINKIIMPTKRIQLFPLGILAETVSTVFMKLLLCSGLKLKGHKQKQDTRFPHSFGTFKPIT